MRLVLKRISSDNRGVFGVLLVDNGYLTPFAVTVEKPGLVIKVMYHVFLMEFIDVLELIVLDLVIPLRLLMFPIGSIFYFTGEILRLTQKDVL